MCKFNFFFDIDLFRLLFNPPSRSASADEKVRFNSPRLVACAKATATEHLGKKGPGLVADVPQPLWRRHALGFNTILFSYNQPS